MTFKVGDTIVCVDPGSYNLERGRHYEVSKIDARDGCCYLGVQTSWGLGYYLAHRFELVQDNLFSQQS